MLIAFSGYVCDVIKTCIVTGFPDEDEIQSSASLQLFSRLFEQPFDIDYDSLPTLEVFVARVIATSSAPTATVMGALVLMDRIAADIESHIYGV